MAWIESHQELKDHPKTRKLARQLGITVPAAIGHLHCLWWWALEYAQDGDLSEYDAEEISFAGMWEGDADQFISALCQSGFLDEAVTPGDYGLHDWTDYAGRLIDLRAFRSQRNKLHRDADLTKAIRKRDEDRCRYCGIAVSWKDRKGPSGGTYDHVDPRGDNSLENVVIACRSCNSSKQQRTPQAANMELHPPGIYPESTPPGQIIYPPGVDKSTPPNQTVPNQTVPNHSSSDEDEDATPSAKHDYPDWFQPLTALKGFKSTAHKNAIQSVREGCEEAGVNEAEVVSDFAVYYRDGGRAANGWSDPVAALVRTLPKQINQTRRKGGNRPPPKVFSVNSQDFAAMKAEQDARKARG